MKSIFEAYRPPYRTGCGSYIFSSDGSMVIDSNLGFDEESIGLLDFLADVMNFQTKSVFNGEVFVDEEDPCVVHLNDNDNQRTFRMRGWGHLTGCGGMKLSAKEASEIQDRFRDFIISLIKGDEVSEELMDEYRLWYHEEKEEEEKPEEINENCLYKADDIDFADAEPGGLWFDSKMTSEDIKFWSKPKHPKVVCSTPKNIPFYRQFENRRSNKKKRR